MEKFHLKTLLKKMFSLGTYTHKDIKTSLTFNVQCVPYILLNEFYRFTYPIDWLYVRKVNANIYTNMEG